MTSAPSSGTAPPASPVPEPRATKGTPWRTAACTQACTSAVEVGKATTAVEPSRFELSLRYRLSSVDPTRTRAWPSATRRSSTSAVRAAGSVVTLRP